MECAGALPRCCGRLVPTARTGQPGTGGLGRRRRGRAGPARRPCRAVAPDAGRGPTGMVLARRAGEHGRGAGRGGPAALSGHRTRAVGRDPHEHPLCQSVHRPHSARARALRRDGGVAAESAGRRPLPLAPHGIAGAGGGACHRRAGHPRAGGARGRGAGSHHERTARTTAPARARHGGPAGRAGDPRARGNRPPGLLFVPRS